MFILNYLAQYRPSRYFKLAFVAWDIILLNVAVLLYFKLWFNNFDRLESKQVRTVLLLFNLLWVILLLHKDTFRTVRIERIEAILLRTFKKIFLHGVIIISFVGFLEYTQILQVRLVYFYLLFFAFLFVSRVVSMKVLKFIRAQGYNFKNVVIIGANDTGAKMQKTLSKDLTFGYRVLGFFDDTETESWDSITAPILGRLEAVEAYISKENVDEMYIALHIDNIKIINQLTELCERYMVRIKFILDFQLYTKSRKVEISFYGNTPVLMLRREPLEYTVNRLLKKAFDLLFSLGVIVLIFPWLFPILMIIIKIESPGPIFFKQERTGRDKESFSCWKFRSMYVNKQADQVQTGKGDPRVTKFGAFMRKTSIDELPQFFNVFWGHMSVVGPRPHMVNHTEQYSNLINNYLVRHYAKPGITGWAQVNGYRGETKELIDMQNRVEHDIWYIENWSILLDIKIIIKTILNVFKGEKNAY